jgi:hypothetical protein
LRLAELLGELERALAPREGALAIAIGHPQERHRQVCVRTLPPGFAIVEYGDRVGGGRLRLRPAADQPQRPHEGAQPIALLQPVARGSVDLHGTVTKLDGLGGAADQSALVGRKVEQLCAAGEG